MLIFSGPTGVLTALLAQPLDPKASGGRGSSPRRDPCPFHKLSSLPPLSLSTAARRWPLYPDHAACLLNLIHPAALYLACGPIYSICPTPNAALLSFYAI
jgi:hypothetical protein